MQNKHNPIERFIEVTKASAKTAYTTVASRGTLQSETLKAVSGVSPCTNPVQHVADLAAVGVGYIGAIAETAVNDPMLLPEFLGRFVKQEIPIRKRLIKIR